MNKITSVYILMIVPFLLTSCKETCSFSKFKEIIRNSNFTPAHVYKSSVARYKGTIYYYNHDEKYEQKKVVDNLAFFRYWSTGWAITTPGYDSYVRIEQNVMIQIKKTIADGSIQYYGNAEFEEPGQRNEN